MEKTFTSAYTEYLSINKLKEAVLKTGLVEPDIRELDRTPSWDGELRIYEKPGRFCKDGLRGRIPIQVKGTMVQNFSKGKASFQVECSDLRNYWADGGVLFFLVQVRDHDNAKIFYASLLPFDLQKLLKKAGPQKTVRIRMEEFPAKHKDGMIRVFDGFLDAKRLGAPLPNITSVKDFEKKGINVERYTMSIPAAGIKSREELFKEVFQSPQYVYAETKSFGIQFVVDKVHLKGIKQHWEMPIIVKGERFYDGFDSLAKPGEKEIFQFGKSIRLHVKENNSFTLQFEPKGTLHQRIHDTKLILSMMREHQFSVGQIEMGISSIGDDSVTRIQEQLQDYLRIDAMLKKLHVQKEFDMDALSNDQEVLLYCLADCILEKKPLLLAETDDVSEMAATVELGNLSLLFHFMPICNNAAFIVRDYFDVEMAAGERVEPHKTWKSSPYITITAELFRTLDNISLSEIAPAIKRIPYTSGFGDQILTLVLELLKYFDLNGPAAALDVAAELLNYLQAKDPAQKKLYKINRLQTEKRRRPLRKAEKQYLLSLKSSGASLQYQLAASILLESFQEAQLVYEQMDRADRETFDAWPISRLWQRDHNIISEVKIRK